MKRDYYEVLGITKNATLDEIKKAYRKLAMANHPDKNPGDKAAEDRFKEATEAYEVLSDENKRRNYDQFGFAGVDQNAGYQNAYRDFGDIFQGFGSFSGGSGLDDILNQFFGGGRSSGGQRRSAGRDGKSLQAVINIDLLDAVKGTSKPIEYAHDVKCSKCNGKGTEHPDKVHKCPTCKGSGVIITRQGFFTSQRTCTTCFGTGNVIDEPCSECKGSGLVHKKTKISVDIPRGVEDNTNVLLRGMGDAGFNGGRDGDLYVKVKVKENARFKRKGNDLFCKLPISPSKAALGGQVEFTLIDGEVIKIDIPEGQEGGKYLKIKGKGINPSKKGLFNREGDLYVEIYITTPKKISKKVRELYESIAKELNEENKTELMDL